MWFRSGARADSGAIRAPLSYGAAIAVISVLCVAAVGSDLYRTLEARSHEIEASRREVVNLAWSAAQHAEEAFHLADTSLIGLVERVEVDGTAPTQLDRMRRVMALHMAASPILQALNLMDEHGDVIASGLQVTGRVNIADRAHFQRHATHTDRGPFISQLVQSRVSGQWVIATSRRVNHADGSFAGIVSANVSMAYFQGFYDTFDLGHDGSAALLTDDGNVLARHPAMETPGSISLGNTSLFRDLLPKSQSGSFELRSSIDGVMKIYAYRRVAGFPLVVVVALSMDEELAAWRSTAIQHLIAAIAVALLLGFFAIRLVLQIRLLARAEQTASATNVELDRLARRLGSARDQAEQASQAKSRFLTGMTHELRTPLHGILGYAELLRLEGGLNPTQSERVAAMIAAGEHLLGMINAVLDVSQIEADRLELHPAEIELTDFVHACLDVIRPAAHAKRLVLVPPAPVSLRIFADPTRLRQVLINLLGNAVKFTQSGSIGVRLQRTEDGSSVRLEVADTGPGIRAAHHDKLFQNFERLNAEAVNEIEGTGIGLALAARLVQRMGGRIGYADNPGGGSVFWLELPASGVVPTATAVTAKPAPAAGRGLHVLVVDDDALNRTIATGFLKHGGHKVVCLDNGAAAVAAASAEDFDVILMDVRMPGMDGLEATRRIRAIPGPRGKVPVVAATAQMFKEQIEICRQAGMNTHVSKPFTQSALLAAVEEMVALELPILDRTQFEAIAGSLPQDDVKQHLRNMIARSEALLDELHSPGLLARVDKLAEAAHLLTGGAATFGFLALADAGRRFEFAADRGTPETEALAQQLAAAIEAAATIMRREIAGVAAAVI